MMRFLPLPARPLRLAIAFGGALALLSACDASRAYIVMDDQKRERLLAARDSAESEATRPIEAKKPSNTVVVATKADYRPREFLDENGQAQGPDADILKAAAKDQGFNVVFSPLSPSSGLNSLLATLGPGGGADAVARALPSNLERAEKYGQTQAYSLRPTAPCARIPRRARKGPGIWPALIRRTRGRRIGPLGAPGRENDRPRQNAARRNPAHGRGRRRRRAGDRPPWTAAPGPTRMTD